MENQFLIRHGMRIAALSALSAILLFTVVTVLNYSDDLKLVHLWEGYLTTEEQLFRLRADANEFAEIQHRSLLPNPAVDAELAKVGDELVKIPSLKRFVERKKALIARVRELVETGGSQRAEEILRGPELTQIDSDLRGALFQYELNERGHEQTRMSARVDAQEGALNSDFAAMALAGLLILSAGALVLFYVKRLRRYDRDLVAARHEAERASRMKSSFLANMSHEIRTPLNGVTGLTRLLRETPLSGEQASLVESLEASGRTLLSIVNDILDLSKIESGKVVVEQTDFDVRGLLADLEKAFRPVAERKRLRLVTEGPSDSVYARGDSVKIRQIVQNLVSNALKFTREGDVRVRWRLEGGMRGPFMRFEVKDTGIGIPEDAMYRIFHPFEQADSSTSRNFGGSGLGLAICRHLVDAMGGELGVESRVGLGSLFWFTVPFVPAETKVIEITRSGDESAARSDAHENAAILLVEDNEVNQHLVVKFLERRGYRVQGVVNGVEALQALRQNPFHLILMDAHLPEMDGFEATKRIRAGEAGLGARDLPIIALTASAIAGERERCLGVGMDDYLTKPIDLDLLEKTIRDNLGDPGKANTMGTGAESTSPNGTRPAAGPRILPNDLDEELYGQLAAIYRRVTPQRVRDFKAMLEKQDWKGAGKAAHTVKSSAAQLGLWDLADLCKTMEKKGFAEESTDWGPLVAKFDEEIARANDVLPNVPEEAFR